MVRTYSGRDCGKIIEPLIRGAKRRLWIVSPYISREYAEILVEKARQGVDVRVVTCDIDENADAIEVLRRGGVGWFIYSFLVVALSIVGLAMGLLGYGNYAGPILAFASFLGLATNIILLLSSVKLWLLALGIAAILLMLPITFAGWRPSVIDLVGNLFLYQAIVSSYIVAYLNLRILRKPKPRTELEVEKVPITSTQVVGSMSTAMHGYDTMSSTETTILDTQLRRGVALKLVHVERFVHSKIYVCDDVAIVGSANLTRAGLWKNYETITIFEGEEVREVEKMFLEIWNSV